MSRYAPITVIYVKNPKRSNKITALLHDSQETNLIIVDGLISCLNVIVTKFNSKSLVLVDSFGRYAATGSLISLILRSTFVIRMRGDFFREEYERMLKKNNIRAKIIYYISIQIAELCLKHAKAVIYNSEHLYRIMGQRTGNAYTTIIHNPFTQNNIDNSNAHHDLVFTGYRILSVTNMNVFSKVSLLSTAITDWVPNDLWNELDIKWIICGSGAHEEWLRKKISNSSLKGRVELVGRVDPIDPYYSWCDVFVHLTTMDSFPNVVLEAMWHKKPVIINHDSCGAREQVTDSVNGRIIYSCEDFKQALMQYHSDNETRDRHGVNGFRLVNEKYTPQVLSPLLVNELDTISKL